MCNNPNSCNNLNNIHVLALPALDSGVSSSNHSPRYKPLYRGESREPRIGLEKNIFIALRFQPTFLRNRAYSILGILTRHC